MISAADLSFTLAATRGTDSKSKATTTKPHKAGAALTLGYSAVEKERADQESGLKELNTCSAEPTISSAGSSESFGLLSSLFKGFLGRRLVPMAEIGEAILPCTGRLQVAELKK